MSFNHIPVLLKETIEGLNIKEDGIYVDCTLGGAGHAEEILKILKSGKLIGIDQDEAAIKYSSEKLSRYGDRFIPIRSNFDNIGEILKDLGIDKIDGAMMDIGVSSHQIDESSRGFSYMEDAILDMRMDDRVELSAKEIVNSYTKAELEDIFWKYGEEKWGRRIAEFIVDKRASKTINTTYELVDIIQSAIPKAARKNGGHPAKRVFQALRIEVNKELDVLTNTIPSIVEMMNPGSRLAIITFHSLEDRIVKNIFKDLSRGCICPKDFPICVCNHERKIKIINRKPIIAGDKELKENSRAKSAKLRIAQRV
ncbi:MAG: 16S rRNA (cytosine(1402)-N(4))-methyltransferase RsmH [Tissierellia bacterium]|nr:16S rRNA (cytosine(1402)-N(4))-methyltransferase RsmH [Tissierellia bacterium]